MKFVILIPLRSEIVKRGLERGVLLRCYKVKIVYECKTIFLTAIFADLHTTARGQEYVKLA